MSNQPVKIQINSLEALERLIGNDSPLEIELRQSVVEAFAKKHLKSLATAETVKAAENTVYDFVSKELFTKVKDGWSEKNVLNASHSTAVLAVVERKVKESMTTLVFDALKRGEHSEMIDKIISEQIQYITKKWTEGYIERQIATGVQKTLKEKLGITI